MELHPSRLMNLLLFLCSVHVCLMCVRVQADAMVPQICPTNTSQPCQAVIGYVPSSNYNLLEIASLYSLNYTSLLGPNDIDPSLQNLLPSVVLPAAQPAFIPQTCGCKNGKRVVTSANYTVVPGNTLSLISDTIYSGLVTYQEIAEANGVTNPDLIDAGQVFSIPIPCACFNQSNGTQPSIALSYQIKGGDSLEGIADAHNTSVAALQALNSLPDTTITPLSILFVPLSVCKPNFTSAALDKDLAVIEAKYELTANGCVKCSCANGTLHCVQAPSLLATSTCGNFTCPSSNLTLGSSTTSQTNGQCTVQSCVYKGYTAQSGIIATLEIALDNTCPGALPPETFYKPPSDIAASPLPTNPSITLSSPPPSTGAGTAPSPPTNTGPASAASVFVGIGFSSRWWWLLLSTLLLL